MDKLNSKCRTCLNAFSKGLQSLTKKASEEDEPEKSYAQLLNELANINVMNDTSSKMPKFICSCCSRKLKAAHAFVQQAQDANEKLYRMLIEQKEYSDAKQVDCLQETQIDIDSCLQIKIECDDTDENESRECVMKEHKTLEKSIQLKKEVTKQEQEEDALETNNLQLETDLITSNGVRNTSNVSMDNLDIKDKNIIQIGDKCQNSSQENIETFDANSIRESTSAFSSENDDLPLEKIKLSTKKTRKKKTSSVKHSKKSRMASKEDLKVEDNDESLPAKCEDCDKIFANARLLNRHRRGTHVPDELKIQCLYCEAKFSRRHNMYAHVRQFHKMENPEENLLPNKKILANKEYPCQECSRSYTNKYKLRQHVKTHHNPENMNNDKSNKSLQPKKRFLCNLCGLTFDNQSNLNIHFRRHTGEKPYKCDFCDRAYHRLYDVQVHRRSHTGEKPYQCNLCEKAFRRSNKLKIHMRTHTNERPYKCTQCEKAFKQSKDLNIHKRTHTGERPYKCTVCQSTFTQSNSLRLHQIKQKHFETPLMVGTVTEDVPFLFQQT